MERCGGHGRFPDHGHDALLVAQANRAVNRSFNSGANRTETASSSLEMPSAEG